MSIMAPMTGTLSCFADFLEFGRGVAPPVTDQPAGPAPSEGPADPEVVFPTLRLSVGGQEPVGFVWPRVAEVVVPFAFLEVVVPGDKPALPAGAGDGLTTRQVSVP